MRSRFGSLALLGLRLALATVLLVATFTLVRWWDFTLPSLGRATYQAVFLANGQVFFGRYYDRFGPYVKVASAYYIQQTSDPSDPSKPPESKIVRRGSELHGPPPEMLVPRGSVLFVEDLAASSPVAQFMARDRP